MIESITLEAHIPSKPEHTDFAGELVVDAAWDAKRFHCELKLLDPALYWATRSCGFPLGRGEDLGDGRRLYRWKVWDMQIGRYEFRIESARFCRTFELSKGGQCTLELAAPTVVRIVDDWSRETRKIPDLVLRTSDSSDVIERLPMSIRGGEFLAPVGDWLAVQTPTFSKTVHLVPGINEIAVPMPSH